jgi:hypothetical protein
MDDLMVINMNEPSLEGTLALLCAELWYFHTKGFT